MEEQNKKILFTSVKLKEDSIEPVPFSRKEVRVPSLDNSNYISIPLKHGVLLTVTKDSEEDYSKIETLQDIILLNKRKPNNIVGMSPPLFPEFINKTTNSINTGVSIGDSVKCKAKFMDNKGNKPRQVKDLYLKGLNNMTIVVATLEDDDFYIANRLEKCK